MVKRKCLLTEGTANVRPVSQEISRFRPVCMYTVAIVLVHFNEEYHPFLEGFGDDETSLPVFSNFPQCTLAPPVQSYLFNPLLLYPAFPPGHILRHSARSLLQASRSIQTSFALLALFFILLINETLYHSLGLLNIKVFPLI